MTKMSPSWSDYCKLCCSFSSECVSTNWNKKLGRVDQKGHIWSCGGLERDGTSGKNVLLGTTISSSCISVLEYKAFTHGGCSFNQSPSGKICSACTIESGRLYGEIRHKKLAVSVDMKGRLTGFGFLITRTHQLIVYDHRWLASGSPQMISIWGEQAIL